MTLVVFKRRQILILISIPGNIHKFLVYIPEDYNIDRYISLDFFYNIYTWLLMSINIELCNSLEIYFASIENNFIFLINKYLHQKKYSFHKQSLGWLTEESERTFYCVAEDNKTLVFVC